MLLHPGLGGDVGPGLVQGDSRPIIRASFQSSFRNGTALTSCVTRARGPGRSLGCKSAELLAAGSCRPVHGRRVAPEPTSVCGWWRASNPAHDQRPAWSANPRANVSGRHAAVDRRRRPRDSSCGVRRSASGPVSTPESTVTGFPPLLFLRRCASRTWSSLYCTWGSAEPTPPMSMRVGQVRAAGGAGISNRQGTGGRVPSTSPGNISARMACCETATNRVQICTSRRLRRPASQGFSAGPREAVSRGVGPGTEKISIPDRLEPVPRAQCQSALSHWAGGLASVAAHTPPRSCSSPRPPTLSTPAATLDSSPPLSHPPVDVFHIRVLLSLPQDSTLVAAVALAASPPVSSGNAAPRSGLCPDHRLSRGSNIPPLSSRISLVTSPTFDPLSAAPPRRLRR